MISLKIIPKNCSAKLSVFTILVPNCPDAKLFGAKLSDAKFSYHHVALKKKITSLDIAQISFDPKTETDDQGYDFVLVSGSGFGVADVCNLLKLPANQGR